MEEMSLVEFSERIDIPVEELKGKSRKENIAIARELYWLYLNSIGYGYRKISQIDGRKPETILSGIRTVKNLIDTNHTLIEPYKELIESFSQEETPN